MFDIITFVLSVLAIFASFGVAIFELQKSQKLEVNKEKFNDFYRDYILNIWDFRYRETIEIPDVAYNFFNGHGELDYKFLLEKLHLLPKNTQRLVSDFVNTGTTEEVTSENIHSSETLKCFNIMNKQLIKEYKALCKKLGYVSILNKES